MSVYPDFRINRQRPQFTAHAFETQCEVLGLEHERIPVATPNMNAFIESWHAQLERQCLAQEFATYAEAYAAVTQWGAAYNIRRVHGSLNYWSPCEMREHVQAGPAHWMPVRDSLSLWAAHPAEK